jgi:hypothetical protein
MLSTKLPNVNRPNLNFGQMSYEEDLLNTNLVKSKHNIFDPHNKNFVKLQKSLSTKLQFGQIIETLST